MTTSLFISYSRREAPFVDSLLDALEDHGLNVWLDYHCLIPARPWREQIFAGIKEAEIFLLIVSKESLASKNVEPEWRRAIELKKRIVLVIFEAVKLPPELEPYEWVDFRGSFKLGLKKLFSQLESPVKAEKPPPQTGFNAPPLVWAACVLSLIVAGLSLRIWWTFYFPYYLLPLPYRILKRDFNFFHIQSSLVMLPFVLYLGEVVLLLSTEASNAFAIIWLASFIFAPLLLVLLRSAGMQRWGKPIASRPNFANPFKPNIKNPKATPFAVDFAPEDQKYAADLIEGLQKYGHPYVAERQKAEANFVLISKYKNKTDYPLEEQVVYPIILQSTKDIDRSLQRIQWIDFRRGLRNLDALAQLLPEPTQLLKALGIVPLGHQTIFPPIIQALVYFFTVLAVLTPGSWFFFIYRNRAELSSAEIIAIIGQVGIFLAVLFFAIQVLMGRAQRWLSLPKLIVLIGLLGFLTVVQFVTGYSFIPTESAANFLADATMFGFVIYLIGLLIVGPLIFWYWRDLKRWMPRRINRHLKFLLICLALSQALMACASSITPQPTASAIPTTIPTAIPTPTPAIIPTPTLPLPTPTAAMPPLDSWSSPSPDGKWIAQGMMTAPFITDDGSEKYQTRLEVVTASGVTQWTLVEQTLNYGLGYTTPRPLQWSRDGRYLYFTNQAVPDGCALFHNGSDLYRADLTNGEVTEIVPASVWWVSLSADEQTVAYIRWNGQALELVARDIATKTEHQTELAAKYTQAGHIVWSPDGQALMLTLAANPCDSAKWVQSIARVDLAALSPTILVRDDKRLLVTVEWPEANRVLLTDANGNSWSMEATTGELTSQ